MSASVIVFILLGIALVLMAIEVFLVPGFGIFGILSAGSVISADIMIFNLWGAWAALGALAAFGAITLFVIWWVARSKTLEKVSLHSTIDSTNATSAQLSVKVGDEGIALTRLALIGNAEIGGKVVEVKSSGNFIDEGKAIVVINVNEALILVKEK